MESQQEDVVCSVNELEFLAIETFSKTMKHKAIHLQVDNIWHTY